MTINIAPPITIITKTPPPPLSQPFPSQHQQLSSPSSLLPSSPRNSTSASSASIILLRPNPPSEKQQQQQQQQQQQPSAQTSHFVQALHDYLPVNAPVDESVSCLFFRKGTIIEVLSRDTSGWWDGMSNGVRGWFPSNYVGRIGEATRDSADFEDEASQQQWDTWRNAVQHQHEEELEVVQEFDKTSLPLPSKQQQESSLNRVQLARALLSQGRRCDPAMPSNSNNSSNSNSNQESNHEDEDEDGELVVQPRWEILMEDVAKLVSELVTMMDTTKKCHLSDDIQMHIFQVVSAIRGLLTAANAVSNDAPLLKTYPDLARQRKIILSTLSKLVLKGKSSSHPNVKTSHAIASLANQLLMELEVFEEHLRNVSELTTSTTFATLSSYGTPVGSSSPRSSVDGDGDGRTCTSAAAADTIATTIPSKATAMDPRPILQTLVTHQTTIDELVHCLVSTIEKYLADRQRDSGLLTTTRKTIVAIRTFLNVIEHVCSHVGDLDYPPPSSMTLPLSESTAALVLEDPPHLVALVLAKETVYSANTDLVASVRAVAGLGQHHPSSHEDGVADGKRTQQEEKEVLQGLRKCCEHVVKTTHACMARVRICLGVSVPGEYDETDHVYAIPLPLDDQQQQQLLHHQKHESAQTHSSVGSNLWRTSADSACTSLTVPEVMSPLLDQTPLPPPKNQPNQQLHLRGLVSKSSEPTSLHTLAKQDQPSSIRHASSLVSMNGTDRGLRGSNHGKIGDPQEPWFLHQRIFSDEMTFNSDGQVMGATVEALVEKLTQHEKSPELLFLRAFFYNFRLFTTPTVFLDMLIKRFDLQPPVGDLSEQDLSLWTSRVLLPVRLRVYNVIKIWLETFFCYETDGSMEQVLIEFVMGPMNMAMALPAKRMIELVRKRFSAKNHTSTTRKLSYSDDAAASLAARPTLLLNNTKNGTTGTNSLFSTRTLFDDHSSSSSESATAPAAPTPSITRSLKNTLRKAMAQGVLSSVPINDFEPIEIARQLTLMESRLFCQIEPIEMIGQEFKKKVGSSNAVHVKAMIQRSTQITSWVEDTILHESDVKKRGQMIKLWIKVGDNCLQLRNYNTLMAIRSALDSTSVARLKRTWETVSQKYKAMYDPIHRATDSKRNFAEYRRRLRDAVAPCLPFLGVYLTDMTFIDDGNANYRTAPNTGAQLINFDKYVKTTRILNEIDQFQVPYKLVEVEEIQRYLLQCLKTVEKDDQVFYTRSLQLEPREEDFDIKSFISNLA